MISVKDLTFIERGFIEVVAEDISLFAVIVDGMGDYWTVQDIQMGEDEYMIMLVVPYPDNEYQLSVPYVCEKHDKLRMMNIESKFTVGEILDEVL